MNILELKHIEDCLDGSTVKEVILDQIITSEFIHALGKEGTLQYFPHFARPFFKVRIDGKLNIKGVEGNTTLRIRLEIPVEEHLALLTTLVQNT